MALHFATERVEHFDGDGVIWCVDYSATNQLLPDRLKQVLADEGSDVFTAEMLTRAAPTLREFDALANEPFVAFLEPPSLDERIVNQFALFSLMSSPSARFDDVARAAPARLAQDRDPGGAEVGGPRQARSGEHHRAGALPRARRPEPLAEAVLHAQTERGRRIAARGALPHEVAALSATTVALLIVLPGLGQGSAVRGQGSAISGQGQ